MSRLIWVFAGRTVILLVLSWGGSYEPWHEERCFGDPLRSSCSLNYIILLRMRTATAPAELHWCARQSEYSLFVNVISTLFTWTSSNVSVSKRMLFDTILMLFYWISKFLSLFSLYFYTGNYWASKLGMKAILLSTRMTENRKFGDSSIIDVP